MIDCFVNWLIKTLFILLLSFNAIADPSCDNSYITSTELETVYNTDINYQRVSSDHLKQGHLPANLLNEEQAVFVGMTDRGHMYIVADGFRYDYKGKSFFKRATQRKSNNLLSKGIVIKLEDLSGEIALGVEEFFEQNLNAKAISCIKGSCKAISHSGVININDNGMSSVLPSRFLKKYITNGIENSQLFVLGDNSLASMAKYLKDMTNEEMYQFSLHGFLYSGLVLTPVAVAISKML